MPPSPEPGAPNYLRGASPSPSPTISSRVCSSRRIKLAMKVSLAAAVLLGLILVLRQGSQVGIQDRERHFLIDFISYGNSPFPGRCRRGQGPQGDRQGVVRRLHRRREGGAHRDRPLRQDRAQDGQELCPAGHREGAGQGLHQVKVP